MGAGEAAQAHQIHILLDRRRGDLLRALMAARIDHLKARIAETAGEHPRAPVVAVEARLSHHDPNCSFRHRAPSFPPPLYPLPPGEGISRNYFSAVMKMEEKLYHLPIGRGD